MKCRKRVIEPLRRPKPVMVVRTGGKIFYAHIEDNPSAEELIKHLTAEPLTVSLRGGDLIRTGELPWRLKAEKEPYAASRGDILLQGGDQIVLCCGEALGTFACAAKIGDPFKDAFCEAVRENNVISFSTEWDE